MTGTGRLRRAVREAHPTDAVAAALAVVVAVAAGVWFVGARGTAAAVGVGVGVGVAAVLSDTDSPLVHGVAGILVVVAALLLAAVAALSAPLATGPPVVAVVALLGVYCLITSVAGAVLVPLETEGACPLRGMRASGLVASGVGLSLAAATLPGDLTTASPDTALGLVGLVGPVLVLATAVRRLLGSDPAEDLAYSAVPMAVGVGVGLAGAPALSAAGVPEAVASLPSRIPAAQPVAALTEASDLGVSTLVLLVSLALLSVVLSVLGATERMFSTEKGSGPPLVGAGLFGLGVATAVMGSVPGGIAAASVGLFVWDVGSYNRGVRGLAGGSSSARPGLVHAAGIGIVVTVSAPVAYLLYATVTPLVTPSDPSVAAVGLVVLVVVSLPLVYSLRPG